MSEIKHAYRLMVIDIENKTASPEEIAEVINKSREVEDDENA